MGSEKMKQQKGHDYSTLLIWAAALVTVVRYAAAFIASDLGIITGWLSDAITIALGLSGLGMGILDVIGGTYLFDGWRRAMPSINHSWTSRFKTLTFFVIALIVSGVLILVPFTVSRVRHTSMEVVLGDGIWLTGWALLVNVAPYLLIGGVAVGNQVVSVDVRKVSGNFPETLPEEKPDEQKVIQWRTLKKKLSNDDLLAIMKSTPILLAQKYKMTVKAAKDWPEYARKEIEERRKALPH